MDPITLFLLQKKLRDARTKAKERARAVGGWLSENWRLVLALGLVLAYTVLVAKLAFDNGQQSADKKWIAKYNKTVKEFNARIEALKLSSSQVANNTEQALENVGDDINKIHAGVEKDAKREQKQSNAVTPNQCVKQRPTLNDPVPSQVLKAWADMNAAGAKHNPYSDIVK